MSYLASVMTLIEVSNTLQQLLRISSTIFLVIRNVIAIRLVFDQSHEK